MILNLNKQAQDAFAAVDALGNTLKYGELLDFSENISTILPSRSLLFLLTENNVGGIAWSVGCINSGNVPLILNAHIEKELLYNLLDIYRPSYVCVPSLMAVDLHYEVVCEYYGYTLLRTGMEDCAMHPDLSHLLPTSGSTGSPKLVRHKYSNIEAAALNISTFFGLTSNDRPLLVLPLYYTMGLSVVFSHLYVGATVLITNQSMTDKAFWSFMKEQRATSFTGVPYSFEILNLMRFFRMDLPDLTLLTQGGGKIPRQLNLKFAEYCRDTGKRWIATYGQSEGTARMRTGDLAYRDEDGCYYIVGRMGRFLKLFGMRIGLDECEQIIKGKYPIECACVGTDDKMTVYLTDEKYAVAVKEVLVEKTKLVASAFEVKVIADIPKNEAGKILYSKLNS